MMYRKWLFLLNTNKIAKISGLFPGILALLLFSCTIESEKLDPNPTQPLRFSSDTLFFDTVFTDLQTATLRLRVYNPNDKAVNIRSISVNGISGQFPFSFYINGRFGPHQIRDILIEGKDSAYVLMAAKINPRNEDLPFIVKDSLVFDVEGRNQKQDVKILAYGQDANYFRNTTIACNSTWTKSRPYILVDTVSIKRGCTLTIEKGTKIYGYNSAFLIVRGSLVAEGSKDEPITFRGTRLEPWYANAPGQWGGILVMDGGTAQLNDINLGNCFRGIQVGEVGFPADNSLSNAFLLLRNSYIQNVVDYGVLGVKGGILAINNQFADCGEAAFAGLQGGDYELWHNTFGSSGNNPFQRNGKFQLIFADNLPDSRTQTLYGGRLRVKAVNNLITGSEADEVAFGQRRVQEFPFDTLFFFNILKSRQSIYFRNSPANKGNQPVPSDFRFLMPLRYVLAPDTNGAASLFASGMPLDTVRSIFNAIVPPSTLRTFLATDISGKNRVISAGVRPDIGAYNNQRKNP